MTGSIRQMTWGAATAAALVLTLSHVPARGANVPPPASGAKCSLSALWVTSTEPTHRLKVDGVPNFGKLNDHVWRSGQPSAAGYKALASMGLKTVVNLRKEISADADPVPAGVKEVYIPIGDEHAPTAEQADQFLAVVSDPANWPVLVHCQGGQGRAGVMGAVVRYSMDGWDDSRIMKEVGNFRSAQLGFIKIPMAGGQRSFIRDWQAGHEAGEYLKHPVVAP